VNAFLVKRLYDVDQGPIEWKIDDNAATVVLHGSPPD
jgi:hypothetical protein